MATIESAGDGYWHGPGAAPQIIVQGFDFNVTDSDYVEFGDLSPNGDARAGWDGSNLTFMPTVDDTGSLVLGDGTTNWHSIYAGASASTAGSGMTLSATNSAGFAIFTDDGNASISSGTLTRAGRFRNLQVYTGGNREQEACGLIGQLVSVAGTNRHNMAGLFGSYEASTSLTVDGQSAATDTWAQAAVIGRIGVGSAITTINANGVLAGFAAMSNTASFSANNGVYAAFYAGGWSGSSTVDWGYGLYLESGHVDYGIKMTCDLQGIDSTVSALGAAVVGHSFYVTVANPNNQSGTSAYFDSTYTGATAGHCYGLGSWINAGASVFSASHIIVPFEGGVYTSGSNANGRIVFGGQHQAILNDAPASLHCWRLNTTQTITALIAAANQGSIGYVAGAGTSGTQLGYIPLADIVGVNSGNPVYLRVYATAT